MINEHASIYLDGYLSRPKPPGFAVLLAGNWGAGKTFFIKDYFSKHPSLRPLYVSLHGVSSEDDLRRRFVLAAYPFLKNRKLRAIGSLGRSALGVLRFKSDLKITDLLEYDQFDVIVIDDIERVKIPLETVFGFISQMIEDDGRKVIVLGSEKELRKSAPNFKDIKEKVFGFTLSIYPDVASILDNIINDSVTSLTVTIRKYGERISSLFTLSQSDNLRVLKQTLDEYAPVAEFLERNEKLSNAFKQEALETFIIYSISYKLGEIDRGDIKIREGSAFTRIFKQDGDKSDESPVGKLDDKYKGFDVYSLSLDNDFLEARICDGVYREDFLQRTVGDAASQSDPSANPEWRNVWRYMEGDDSATRSSFDAMVRKFKAREYRDAGVITHVIGLLLEGVEVGLLGWQRKTVLREGKAYLDDLIKARELPPIEDDFLGGFRHGAAHGLGFTNAKEKEFIEFVSYYRQVSERLKNVMLEERVKAAFHALSSDPQKFSHMISSSEIDREVYSTPILHTLNVREFADRFLSADGPGQREIMLGLGTRYERNPYPGVLETERPWLEKVDQAIRRKLRIKDRLTKTRVGRLLDWSFEEILGPKHAGDAATE